MYFSASICTIANMVCINAYTPLEYPETSSKPLNFIPIFPLLSYERICDLRNFLCKCKIAIS